MLQLSLRLAMTLPTRGRNGGGAAVEKPDIEAPPLAEEGNGVMSLYRRMVVASPLALKQVGIENARVLSGARTKLASP
jgi:hypothetical protein